VFPSLADIPWLEAGVTTRKGRWPLAAILDGSAAALATARQVHGARVVRVDGPPDNSPGDGRGRAAPPAGHPGGRSPIAHRDQATPHCQAMERWRFPDADALMTSLPGIALAVSTADCVPVLVVDPEHRVVGVAHAGWRGLAGGVIAELTRSMREAFGTRAEASRAAVGPAIGPCCYPVGEEVITALGTADRHAAFLPVAARSHLDLWTTSERQLVAAGFPPGAVESLRFCTGCHPELFFSWRRDGAILGQMRAFVLVKPS
jgi:YfiH family protein